MKRNGAGAAAREGQADLWGDRFVHVARTAPVTPRWPEY